MGTAHYVASGLSRTSVELCAHLDGLPHVHCIWPRLWCREHRFASYRWLDWSNLGRLLCVWGRLFGGDSIELPNRGNSRHWKKGIFCHGCDKFAESVPPKCSGFAGVAQPSRTNHQDSFFFAYYIWSILGTYYTQWIWGNIRNHNNWQHLLHQTLCALII